MKRLIEHLQIHDINCKAYIEYKIVIIHLETSCNVNEYI